MAPLGVLVLSRWRDQEALAERLGQRPPATTATCACASSMRSTASLTLRFSPADCSTSEVSVGSLKVDHHAAVCAGSGLTWAAPSVPLPVAVADHCAGTAGFGSTKLGPMAQPARVQPREASTRERNVRLAMQSSSSGALRAATFSGFDSNPVKTRAPRV